MLGSEFLEKLKKQFERILKVDERVVELMSVALLSGGHVLLEGDVELARILVRILADSIGLSLKVIQITPELTAHDRDNLKDNLKTDTMSSANILYIYDLTRIRMMQVSKFWQMLMEVIDPKAEDFCLDLPEPFMVVAYSSSSSSSSSSFHGISDMTGVLDIFMVKIPVRPSEICRLDFNDLNTLNIPKIPKIDKVFDHEQILSLIDEAKLIWAGEAIFDYIYELTLKIKSDERVAEELSHQASEHLLLASKALAFLKGRNYVLPDDVKYLAENVLSHRLVLRSGWLKKGLRSEDLVREILGEVEIPK